MNYLSNESDGFFIDIPKELEDILEDAINQVYEVVARNQVPCLEEIIGNMHQYIMYLAHYDFSGEKVDDKERDFSEMLSFIEDYLGSDKFCEYYARLTLNVEHYLITKKFFFERNWLYGSFNSDYLLEYYNPPIDDSW